MGTGWQSRAVEDSCSTMYNSCPQLFQKLAVIPQAKVTIIGTTRRIKSPQATSLFDIPCSVFDIQNKSKPISRWALAPVVTLREACPTNDSVLSALYPTSRF